MTRIWDEVEVTLTELIALVDSIRLTISIHTMLSTSA